MKRCNQCQRIYPDSVRFCEVCGSPVEEELLICPHCGEKLEKDDTFCGACGKPVASGQERMGDGLPVSANTRMAESGRGSNTFGNGKKSGAKGSFRKAGLAMAAGMLCAGLVFAGWTGIGKLREKRKTRENKVNNDSVFFIKDEELYMAGGDAEDAHRISGTLYEDWLGEGSNGREAEEGQVYPDVEAEEAQFCFIQDGKGVLYADRWEKDAFQLYYRSLKGGETQAVKIGEDLRDYRVTEDEKTVFYRNTDGQLYAHVLGGERRKIAEEVIDFKINADGSRVFYYSNTGLYVQESGKDREKIEEKILYGRDALEAQETEEEQEEYDSDEYDLENEEDFTDETTAPADTGEQVFQVECMGCFMGETDLYANRAADTIYYINDRKELCSFSAATKKKVIAQNVLFARDSVCVYDEGQMYYVTVRDRTMGASALVQDPMRDSDAQAKEPEEPEAPDYPHWYEYEDEKSYEKAERAYEKAYAKYEKAQDAYEEQVESYSKIEDRNEWREQLGKCQISYQEMTVMYRDGEISKELGNSVSMYGASPIEKWAESVPAVFFYENKIADSTKQPSLEELNDADYQYDISGNLKNLRKYLTDRFALEKDHLILVCGGVTQELSDENESYYLDEKAETLTYLQEDALMQCKIVDGKLQPAEQKDADVRWYGILDDSKNQYCYYKNVTKKGRGDLYNQDQRIAEDVLVFSAQWNNTFLMAEDGFYLPFSRDDSLYYWRDYDVMKEAGTFCVWDGNQETVIAYDASVPQMLPDGKLYYLTYYDSTTGCGDLNVWDGSQSETIGYSVASYTMLGNGDLYYLGNYKKDKDKGELYRMEKGEDPMIADDVQGLLRQEQMKGRGKKER